MSIHDEFERAIAGSGRRKGMGALGWLIVSLGMFVVLGVVGAGFAMNRVAHKMEHVLADFDYDPGATASRVVERLESHTQLLSADPDQGLAFLRSLRGGDPAQAFMGEIFDGRWAGDGSLVELSDLTGIEEGMPSVRQEVERVRREIDRAQREVERARAQAEAGGNVHVDVSGREGGSLTIRGDDGQVRMELRRTEDGGFLVIDADDGQSRIDLHRTADGGYLTIDSDDGTVRFGLVRSDHGAELTVDSGRGASLRLALGDDAGALPGWVPQLDGMPERLHPVYSLSANDGVLGAVAWQQDVTAQAALDAFRAQLEEQGYDIRAEHTRNGRRYDEGSLWARDVASGRLVYVVAHETADGTKLLVGYGEETR
jgi:hypothetical protein